MGYSITIIWNWILTGLVMVVALYVPGLLVYRLTLHPLAKYPGPFLGRISDWYIVIRSYAGDRHIHLLELHRLHGPFVRFGPNRLSVNTAEGLHSIYGFNANTRKASYYSTFASIFGGENMLTMIEHGSLTTKRKVICTALSDSSIKSMEELILENVRKFLSRIDNGEPSSDDTGSISKGWSSPKNMSKWASYLTFDIMGNICFSNSFGMLDNTENHYLLVTLPQAVNGINVGGWMPALFQLKIGYLLLAKVSNGIACFRALFEQQVARRLDLDDQIPGADLFSHLIAANRASTSKGLLEVFSLQDLHGESSLLTIAGSDTTALAIASTVFYLLHNPDTYDRLKEEVRVCFQSLEDIRSGLPLTSCVWLRACIDESLRLNPPIPGPLPREVTGSGVWVGGHFFPKRVELSVSNYSLHHNEDYYPEPFAYKPERWTEKPCAGETKEEAANRVLLARSAFCPFSVGPRACIGRSLALKEITIVIARIIWLYDVRLAPGNDNYGGGGAGKGFGRHRGAEHQIMDMFVAKVDGPMVQFRPLH
ncbi:cytochrome P450-like protein [Astrocystis sublimbata]|nr:cytochrome P450-like protein [Astrocystis sublimbata]